MAFLCNYLSKYSQFFSRKTWRNFRSKILPRCHVNILNFLIFFRVHIRRTDKLDHEGGYYELEEYIKYVNEYYEMENYRKGGLVKKIVYLASDDAEVFIKAKNK